MPFDPAEAAARDLAAQAGALELAVAAAAPDSDTGLLLTLLAHELAAGHGLMMRLAAKAQGFLDQATPETALAAEAMPAERRLGLEGARLAGAAGRLMERYRQGLLALAKLRAADRPDGPGRVVGLCWLGPALGADDHDHSHEIPPGLRPTPPAPANRGRLRNGNPSGDYLAAPRCGAMTRANTCCRQPAMANGRCRLHGGKSTGPRTAEGLARSRQARLVHGARSAEVIDLRRAAAASGRRLRALAAAGRPFPAGHGVHRADFRLSSTGSPNRPVPPGRRGLERRPARAYGAGRP